jgi:hypothetical protein
MPSVPLHKNTPSALWVTSTRALSQINLENKLLLCLAFATFAYCSFRCLQTPHHKAQAARAQIGAIAANVSAPAPSALIPLPQSLLPQPQANPPTASDTADTVASLQVQAVRALSSGHRREALAVYQQLAVAVPNAPEYRAAAAILSKKIAPLIKSDRGP